RAVARRTARAVQEIAGPGRGDVRTAAPGRSDLDLRLHRARAGGDFELPVFERTTAWPRAALAFAPAHVAPVAHSTVFSRRAFAPAAWLNTKERGSKQHGIHCTDFSRPR